MEVGSWYTLESIQLAALKENYACTPILASKFVYVRHRLRDNNYPQFGFWTQVTQHTYKIFALAPQHSSLASHGLCNSPTPSPVTPHSPQTPYQPRAKSPRLSRQTLPQPLQPFPAIFTSSKQIKRRREAPFCLRIGSCFRPDNHRAGPQGGEFERCSWWNCWAAECDQFESLVESPDAVQAETRCFGRHSHWLLRLYSLNASIFR